jgi:hypothetical protein
MAAPKPKFEFAPSTGVYTPEELDKVEEMAGLLMKPSDIAILLGVNSDLLLYDLGNRRTEVSYRYFYAKAQATLLRHEKEVELAKAGSALAVENLKAYEAIMSGEEM